MKKILFLTTFISIFIILGLILTPINQSVEAATNYTAGYTNPNITIAFSVYEGATLAKGASLSYTVSNNSGLSSITTSCKNPNSNTSNATINCFGETGYTGRLSTSSVAGQYLYTVTALDLNGKTKSATLTVNVAATTPQPSAKVKYKVLENDNNDSIIDGLGEYEPGEKVTLRAKSKQEGLIFANWQLSISGVKNLKSPIIYFNMPEKDVYVTAKFLTSRLYEFERAYIDDPNNPDHYVYEITDHIKGDHIRVRAKLFDNLTFTGWDTYGITLDDPTQREVEFDMPDNYVKLIPRYIKNEITIAVDCDEKQGSVSGAGTYKYGQTITITATPAAGYHFEGWSAKRYFLSSKEKTSTTLTITATDDYAFTANFAKGATGTLVVLKSGKGDITIEGNHKLLAYYAGSTITITATPKENWMFDHWEQVLGASIPGFDYNDNSQPFTMPDYSIILKAVFKQYGYTVNFKAKNGSTSPSGKQTYEIGERISITATPDSGYYFSNWKSNTDLADSSSAKTSFVVPAKNATIEAVFVSEAKVSISKKGPGEVYFGDGSNKDTRSKNFNVGESVTVVAEPNKDCIFLGWLDEDGNKCSTSATYTFKMPAHKVSLKAHFSKREYKVTASASFDTQGGTVSGSGTYEVGQKIYIYAVPALGYRFDGWEKVTGLPHGASYYNSPTIDEEMPPNNVKVVAKFKWVGGY